MYVSWKKRSAHQTHQGFTTEWFHRWNFDLSKQVNTGGYNKAQCPACRIAGPPLSGMQQPSIHQWVSCYDKSRGLLRNDSIVTCVVLPDELWKKENHECVQSAIIKHRIILSLIPMDKNPTPTKIWLFTRKGFNQHSFPGQVTLQESPVSWIGVRHQP